MPPDSQRPPDPARTTSAEETALVRQAQGGDRAAFGRLVERYAGPARRVARAVLRDPDDADDAAQDAFLSAWVHLDRFEAGRPFGPWLMRIVVNAARNRGRRNRVRRTEELSESLPDRTPGPERATERERLKERLLDALEELPVRRRLAVVLFDLEGYSHAEIARMLDMNEGTVRSSVFHARERLREVLADWKELNS